MRRMGDLQGSVERLCLACSHGWTRCVHVRNPWLGLLLPGGCVVGTLRQVHLGLWLPLHRDLTAARLGSLPGADLKVEPLLPRRLVRGLSFVA